ARSHSYGAGVTMIAKPGADLLHAHAKVGGVGESVSREVNLIDVKRVTVDQGSERFASTFLFAGRDGHRRAVAQPDIPIHVTGPERFLQPADVEFGKSVRAVQCGARIPHTTGVDQQRRVVARARARAANQFKVEGFAPAQRFPTELDSVIAGLDPTLRDFPGLFSIPAEQNRRVGLDAIVVFAAE